MNKAVLITVSMIFLLSCEQKEGERCTINSDCERGMECCKPVASIPTSDGVCTPQGECTQSDATTDAVQDPAEDPVDAQDALPDEASDETSDPAAEDAAAEEEPAEDAAQED